MMPNGSGKPNSTPGTSPTGTGRIDVHIYLHGAEFAGSADQKLDSLLALVTRLMAQERTMNADLQASIDRNTAAANAETTVEASVETLLTGLAATIASLKSGVTDPAVLAAIDNASGIVEAANVKAAAVVVANTPAA